MAVDLFRYPSYTDDLTSAPTWQPGDPWDQHYTAVVGTNDRDTSLESFLELSRTYINFTFTLTQNLTTIAHTDRSAFYTKDAWVSVEIVTTITSAGFGGAALRLNAPGLPVPYIPVVGGFTQNYNLGTFAYNDVSTGLYVGTVWWTHNAGSDILFFRDQPATVPPNALGLTFATANTDELFIQMRYRPA